MSQIDSQTKGRRYFVGGSDARIIMGDDEAALLRLWREKRGEVEPEDLSGNLIVQLGLATEELNRRWYQVNTGQLLKDVQQHIRHPALRWMAATLDGCVFRKYGHHPDRWTSWGRTVIPLCPTLQWA